MPGSADHVAKAEHNESFAAWLLAARKPEYHDWVLVGSFYAAVHWVEAVLARHHHHSASHADRADGIRRHFRVCYGPYRYLKDVSMSARYACKTVSTGNYDRGAGRCLREIRRQARTALESR